MSNSMYAGFARTDITPPFGGVPLAGYGSTKFRLAATVLDPLYINSIALGRDRKAECVLMTADLIGIPDPLFSSLREAVSEATGLPQDRIYIGGTHTHSAPDLHSDFDCIKTYREEILPKAFRESALRAIADLKPAQISYGKTEVGHDGARLNFNRYYYMVPREKLDGYTEADLIPVGDNYGDMYARDQAHYAYVGHEEEADHELMVVKLARENADDIIMLNFTAHATITGGIKAPNMSSDYPGAFRSRVEQLIPGTKCTFLQGCAGNTNANTRMAEEGLPGLTFGLNRSHYAYAAVLGGTAKLLISKGLTDSETDVLAFSKRIVTGKRDHSMDKKVPEAEKIAAIYLKDGYTEEVRHMCWDAGFNSPYHVTAAIRKSKAPLESDFELNAIRLGDVAFTTGPFELFSGTGKHIKAASPFKMTVVKAYSCGSFMYLPSINSYPNSYEANQTAFERGTAEKLEPIYQEMLEELYEK